MLKFQLLANKNICCRQYNWTRVGTLYQNEAKYSLVSILKQHQINDNLANSKGSFLGIGIGFAMYRINTQCVLWKMSGVWFEVRGGSDELVRMSESISISNIWIDAIIITMKTKNYNLVWCWWLYLVSNLKLLRKLQNSPKEAHQGFWEEAMLNCSDWAQFKRRYPSARQRQKKSIKIRKTLSW